MAEAQKVTVDDKTTIFGQPQGVPSRNRIDGPLGTGSRSSAPGNALATVLRNDESRSSSIRAMRDVLDIHTRDSCYLGLRL